MGAFVFFVTGKKDYSNILPMRRKKNDEGSDEKVEGRIMKFATANPRTQAGRLSVGGG
jgi:hypothetical protein